MWVLEEEGWGWSGEEVVESRRLTRLRGRGNVHSVERGSNLQSEREYDGRSGRE